VVKQFMSRANKAQNITYSNPQTALQLQGNSVPLYAVAL